METSPGFYSGRGERPGHLEAITPIPAGGLGGRRPREVSEVSFLKRCKVLENESIFQKYQHFPLTKNPFFKEISKFHKNF